MKDFLLYLFWDFMLITIKKNRYGRNHLILLCHCSNLFNRTLKFGCVLIYWFFLVLQLKWTRWIQAFLLATLRSQFQVSRISIRQLLNHPNKEGESRPELWDYLKWTTPWLQEIIQKTTCYWQPRNRNLTLPLRAYHKSKVDKIMRTNMLLVVGDQL